MDVETISKASYQKIFCPNYESLPKLISLANEIGSLYAEKIDAVLMSIRDMRDNIKRTKPDGRLTLNSALLTILHNEDILSRSKTLKNVFLVDEIDDVVDKYRSEDIEICPYHFNSKNFIDGVGRNTESIVPLIVLYSNPRFDEMMNC